MFWRIFRRVRSALAPYVASLRDLLNAKNPVSDWVFRAERVGFEPTVPVKTRWFSRPEP